MLAAHLYFWEVEMRVTKDQIINGVISFVETDVIPQVDDKATQIIASIAVKAVKANTKLVDSIFENQLVKTLLDVGEDGTYEIEGLFKSIEESVREFGAFPVELPAVPFISPTEKTLKFDAKDVSEIKRLIERSN
jgi:hypothetical protein